MLDPHDQMTRYLRWWREGHWSSLGRCFGIGNTTRAALERFVAAGDPFAGRHDPLTAGKGSLMRLAPVAMRYADHAPTAVCYAGESSQTTHGARGAIDACRYLAALLVGALTGHDKAELLSPRFAPADW